MSSNSSQTKSVAVGVRSVGVGSVSVGQISRLSLSLSLVEPVGSAAVAGGLAVGGAHSGPVRVGIVQSRGIAVAKVARLGLSLAGGNGDNGSSNLE